MFADVSSWLNKHKYALLAAICCVQVAALLYDLWFYVAHAYLPLPFFYDKRDSFMDFFHPAFWAMRDGLYSEWGSFYPPLTFWLLKLLCAPFVAGQNFSDTFALRQSFPDLVLGVIALFVAAPLFVVSRNYWKIFSPMERALLCVAFITSAPFLFGLERGNLICLTLFLLPFLFFTPRARLIAIALLINLKPYFLVLIFGYVIKKDWRGLMVVSALTAGIYLLTCALLGCSPLAMPLILLAQMNETHPLGVREVLGMPSSVSALSYVLGSEIFQQSQKIPPTIAMLLAGAIEAVKWIVIAGVMGGLWRSRHEITTKVILTAILMMIPNLSFFVGGYTLMFYFIVLPVLDTMPSRLVYFSLLAIIALPLDLLVLAHDVTINQIAYLSGQNVDAPWVLGAGSLIRPVCSLLLLATMAWDLWRARHGQHVAELEADNVIAK